MRGFGELPEFVAASKIRSAGGEWVPVPSSPGLGSFFFALRRICVRG